MGIDKFYVGGEINWVMILEDLDSNDNIPEKAKMLKSIINHEANKQSETYYERGWDACKVMNNKIKRFGTRSVKDQLLNDEFAVLPLRDFVKWYSSVMDEIRFVDAGTDKECCKEAVTTIADKMESSLKDIRTDRRLIFAKDWGEYNSEDPNYERED